jgi:hypothetical protein
MEIYKLYESVIIETQAESCVKRFGYELFGHELGGTEKNTGLENNYVRHIEDFTDNRFGEETTPEFISAIKTLKGCMKQYPDVLIPEKSKVYRGLTIPISYFINKKTPVSLVGANSYVYKATSKIQSWSTDFDSAAIFGSQEILNEIAVNIDFKDYATPETRKELLTDMVEEDLRVAFVLEYKTNPREFIFKSKYFRMLSAAYHENELIRIDNEPIIVNAKFNDTSHIFLSKKGFILMKYINKAIMESSPI